MITPPTTPDRRSYPSSAAKAAQAGRDPLPTDRRLLAFALVLLFLGSAATTYAVRRITDAGGGDAAAAPTTAAAPVSSSVNSGAASDGELPASPAEIEEQFSEALRPTIEEPPQYADPFVERFPPPQQMTPGAAINFAGRGTAGPPPLAAAPAESVAPDLRSRLTEWQRVCREAKRAGQVCAPRLSAYLLDELLPIGTVRVRAARSVWIYVRPEKVTFSVPLQSHFHDATLIDANVEGAVFQTARGETKVVAWSASPDVEIAPGGAPAPASPPPPPPPPTAPLPTPAAEEPPAGGGGSPERDQSAAPAAGEARGRGEQQQQRRPRRAAPLATPLDPTNDHDDLQDAVRERYRRLPAKTAAPRLPVAHALPHLAPSTPTAPPLIASSSLFDADRLTPGLFARYAPTLIAHDAAAASDAPRFRPALFAADDYFRQRARFVNASKVVNVSATAAAQVGAGQTIAAAAAATATPNPPAAAPGGQQQARERTVNPLCDPAYIGEPISVETTRPLTLSDLVRTINTSFKANIVLDNEVQNLPVNLTFVDAPWNQILRTQLDLNDLDVICAEGNGLVQIAKRSKIAQIQEQKRRGAAIVREVFRLRYLQPTAGGRTDLAGRVQGGASATLQSLDETIREILRAGGDARAEFRRIPGRNEFLVAATADQIAEIRRLIDRVDRPGYQVVIRALVYNVNEDRLTDVGSQLAAVVGNAAQTSSGGFTTLPNTPRGTNNPGGNGAPVDGRNPGGIPTPGRNFAIPGGLEVAAPTGVLGVTTIVGTAQFAYQLTLAQNRGLINIQSRPFGVVSDGDTFDLVSGVQIPVVTAALAGGSALNFGQVQFIEASRIARITPQVAEAEDGRAGFITLLIQLENNDVASVLYNGYPGVNRQSLQTVMRLRNNETAVIGGLTTDAVQRNQTKVPGLGNIPGLGWLFKRRFDQQSRSRLYFAISVEVIDQSQNIQSFPAPADAVTAPPPPPAAQRPSPFEKRLPNN